MQPSLFVELSLIVVSIQVKDGIKRKGRPRRILCLEALLVWNTS